MTAATGAAWVVGVPDRPVRHGPGPVPTLLSGSSGGALIHRLAEPVDGIAESSLWLPEVEAAELP